MQPLSVIVQMFHVYKTFEDNYKALIDINLHIEKGEFLFLVGPSGAGKTTLMRLLFREERVTSGQIIVYGRNINKIIYFNSIEKFLVSILKKG